MRWVAHSTDKDKDPPTIFRGAVLCELGDRLTGCAGHLASTRRGTPLRNGSAAGRLSQCSLQDRIECAEEPGPVLLGHWGWPTGILPQLPQMPGYITTGKRISDIRLCPLFPGRGDDARPFFEATRCQRDIGSDAHVSSPDALGNPVVGCIRAVADENHAHVRRARRPDWS
jgi:hypothetical protein